MIKHLLLWLFLLVPITAQAEIMEDGPPKWIIKCWVPAGDTVILETFKHYTDDRPIFESENWIRIHEAKTGEWSWIFTFGDNLICKENKVLE